MHSVHKISSQTLTDINVKCLEGDVAADQKILNTFYQKDSIRFMKQNGNSM